MYFVSVMADALRVLLCCVVRGRPATCCVSRSRRPRACDAVWTRVSAGWVALGSCAAGLPVWRCLPSPPYHRRTSGGRESRNRTRELSRAERCARARLGCACQRSLCVCSVSVTSALSVTGSKFAFHFSLISAYALRCGVGSRSMILSTCTLSYSSVTV